MPTSKRLSDKKELFTLSDLNDFVNQAYRAGIPRNAIVRGKISWRGRITEIWISDAELDMTSNVQDDVNYPEGSQDAESGAPYEPPKFSGIMHDDPGLSEKAKEFRENDRTPGEGYKSTYIPRQQLTPGGPVHGGFTVIVPEGYESS